MWFRLTTIILLLSLVLEIAYVIHDPPSRFQTVGGYDGFMALDTRNGRLCSVLPSEAARDSWKKAAEQETDENLRTEEAQIAAVPTCAGAR